MKNGLPKEWSRGPQWASPAARLEWAPVLVAAKVAWAEIEVASVSEGVRPSALLHLTPEELVLATRDAAGQGLLVVPLEHNGRETRAALTSPERFGSWLEAWSGCDDEAIGELLGFPECCRAHFCDTWKRGLADTVTTIAHSMCVDGPEGQREELDVDGPPEANLLLRHLGVRLVPHLPCSPDCEATVELGRRLADVGRKTGVNVAALYRLLDLPATYSALHGVAVVETPHLRLWAGTDYTPDEVRVTRAATETQAPEGMPESTPGSATSIWQDNGFASREAMDASHDVVLDAVRPFVEYEGDSVICAGVGSALDLGSGDGALLAKIAGGRKGRWVGVEHTEARASRGNDRHEGVVEVVHGTIQAWVPASATGRPFDVALLMPGRLLEMEADDADRVRAALSDLAKRLVVYAYGDQLKKYENAGAAGGGTRLACLAREAGLEVTGHVFDGSGVEAAEAEVLP